MSEATTRLTAAYRSRAAAVAAIQQRVVRTLAEIEIIEVRMCQAAHVITASIHRRPRAQRSIELGWRRTRRRSPNTLAHFDPCWRIRKSDTVERESPRAPSDRAITRVIVAEHHESACMARQDFLQLAQRRDRHLQALGQVHASLGADQIKRSRHAHVDFAHPLPRAIPEHLWDLLQERRRRVGQILEMLTRHHDRISDLEETLEECLIAFNAQGKRNRNLSLFWRASTWSPYGETISGPDIRQIFKGRNGRRYPRRIGDISAEKIDWQRVRGLKQENTPQADGAGENSHTRDGAKGGRPVSNIPHWVLARTGQRRRAATLRRIFAQARQQAIERARALKAIKTADKSLPEPEDHDNG